MPTLAIIVPFDSERDLRFALGVLTDIDRDQLARYRLPLLYKSGVRYKRELRKECWSPVKGGCEDWRSALEILRLGLGDCEDLACWRAAELQTHLGESAIAVPKRTTIGWHIVVRRGDGTIEDPSSRLGMGRGKPQPEAVAGRGKARCK